MERKKAGKNVSIGSVEGGIDSMSFPENRRVYFAPSLVKYLGLEPGDRLLCRTYKSRDGRKLAVIEKATLKIPAEIEEKM
jgi:hypothetical protein